MTAPTWHQDTIDSLSQLLAADPSVLALVIRGSLACADSIVDEWSDVDATIVVADGALDRYYLRPSWLAPLGDLLAWSAEDHGEIKTLRVCLDPFRRMDLSFVCPGSLQRPESLPFAPIPDPCRILWSRIPHLAQLAVPVTALPPDPATEIGHLERLNGSFWYKATLAIARIARNDLLVGGHLALDLARDCLVLQMVLRDRQEGTTIHRLGGWGNEVLNELSWQASGLGAAGLLRLIRRCCVLFDDLASQVSDAHQAHHVRIAGMIDQAASYCEATQRQWKAR